MVTKERHWWDWFSIGCLVLLIFFSSYTLEDTGWIEDLNHVTTLALLGLIVGLAIGQSRFNKRHTRWLTTSYSLILILFQIIFLVGDDQPWLEKFSIFLLRISSNLNLLLTNQPLQDGVLFFISMAILYWFIGFFTGFDFSRSGKPWAPVIIAGISMIIIQLFQSPLFRNNLIAAGFFFLFIILIGRLNYLSAHRQWDKHRVTEDKDVSTNFNRFALIIAIVLITTGWSAPILVRLITPGTREQEEFRSHFNKVWKVVDNFFAPFQQKTAYGRGFFGDTLELGLFRVVSEDVIFVVNPPMNDSYESRYYWSARKYDIYSDGVWKNSRYAEDTLVANESMDLGIHPNGTYSRFLFKAAKELFQIYTPGQLLSIDRDSKILSFQYESSIQEIIAIFPIQPLEVNKSYRLNAMIFNPYREDLMYVEKDYPQWVINQYLQLPRSLTPRIKELAQAVTFGKETIYDQVEAITNYLRDNFRYTDVIDNPPDETDPLIWFLFEEQTGFCNYFATAEVILLRTLGIPARISVGYAQGQEIENSYQFEVRGKDNHAWPEVFFPDIGWVIFEPTPSQPLFIHRQRPLTALDENGISEEDMFSPRGEPLTGPRGDFRIREFEMFEEQNTSETVSEPQTIKPQWVILVVVFFLLFIAQKLILHGRPIPVFIESHLIKYGFTPPKWLTNWSKTIRYSPVEKRFAQVGKMLNWLGVVVNPADTPQKRVQELVKIVPNCEPFVTTLLDAYQREVYGPFQADISRMDHDLRNMYSIVLKIVLIDKIRNFARSLRKRFR